MIRTILLFALLSVISSAVRADEPPLQQFRGNLHTHSLWSDGDDFPEMIADWYREQGYHFLALSDHNILSAGQKWMKHDGIVKRGGKDAVEKYQKRFGGGWVETRGEPGKEDYEIRLKPLGEFRTLVEERGRFLMIQSEEISDKAEGLPIHLNAANIQELVQPLGGKTVKETIEANVRNVEEQAKKKGTEIFVHLNHPNFGFAITAEELAEVTSERFFEVYNGHHQVNHLGDQNRPGVERLWDIANTIRLAQLKADPLMGVATDDTHDYHGDGGSRPGRGWIYVESRYLSPEHLIRALKAGRFYASSGVELTSFQFDEKTKKYSLEINAEPGVTYTTEFIGTLADADFTSTPAIDKEGKPIRATRKYSGEIGKTLATVTGPTASYTLTGNELYVRATITSSKPHRDPSFKGQKQQAWAQPVGYVVK